MVPTLLQIRMLLCTLRRIRIFPHLLPAVCKLQDRDVILDCLRPPKVILDKSIRKLTSRVWYQTPITIIRVNMRMINPWSWPTLMTIMSQYHRTSSRPARNSIAYIRPEGKTKMKNWPLFNEVRAPQNRMKKKLCTTPDNILFCPLWSTAATVVWVWLFDN